MNVIVVLICLVIVAVVEGRSEICKHHNPDTMKCRCNKNQKQIDIGLINEPGDEPPLVTTLIISSCDEAVIPADLASEWKMTLTSIKVENINEFLNISATLDSVHLKKMEFLNVGMISEFNNPFPAFTQLEYFKMENTAVGLFVQSFDQVEVKKFILKNVVIKNLQRLEFEPKKQGTLLEIMNCHIIVGESPLSFEYFHNIKIVNTTFEFVKHKGLVTMSGEHIQLANNIFRDTEISVTGKHINVTNTCADGRSSMRLNSTQHTITSYGNKLPTEILHIPNQKFEDNIICKGAKCNCPIACNGPQCQPRSKASNINGETSRCLLLSFSVIIAAVFTKI